LAGLVLATLTLAACGGPAPEQNQPEAASTPSGAAPVGSDAAGYVAQAGAILDAEQAAFGAFFGPERGALETADGIAAGTAHIRTFHTAVFALRGQARALAIPAKATLFSDAFLEHFDRFVDDAQRMLDALDAADPARAADVYRRLKRGAFERLTTLREKLALVA